MSQHVDPATVRVQLASTVILVDDRPDLRVLCLQRRAGSAFVGGMTVFPGGGLDAHDSDAGYAGRAVGLTPDQADARLGVESGGFDYWVAVVRETFEEVGVLLARGSDGGPPPPDIARHRHGVDDGSRTLLDVLVEEDLVLDLGALHDIGRWITPVGPPRRYDTRFFVAHTPRGQHVEVDAVEAVHAEWRRPADAVTAFREGELTMLPPTLCVLQVLAAFDSAQDVISAASRARGPGRPARVQGDDRGSFTVSLPGDPGYEAPDTRETWGWIYDLATPRRGAE